MIGRDMETSHPSWRPTSFYLDKRDGTCGYFRASCLLLCRRCRNSSPGWTRFSWFWPQNTWALWVILGQVYDILHSFWSQLRLPRTRSTMANWTRIPIIRIGFWIDDVTRIGCIRYISDWIEYHPTIIIKEIRLRETSACGHHLHR